MHARSPQPARRIANVSQVFGLSEALDDELAEAAARLGISRSEAIRRALRLWLDNSFSEPEAQHRQDRCAGAR